MAAVSRGSGHGATATVRVRTRTGVRTTPSDDGTEVMLVLRIALRRRQGDGGVSCVSRGSGWRSLGEREQPRARSGADQRRLPADLRRWRGGHARDRCGQVGEYRRWRAATGRGAVALMERRRGVRWGRLARWAPRRRVPRMRTEGVLADSLYRLRGRLVGDRRRVPHGAGHRDRRDRAAQREPRADECGERTAERGARRHDASYMVRSSVAHRPGVPT